MKTNEGRAAAAATARKGFSGLPLLRSLRNAELKRSLAREGVLEDREEEETRWEKRVTSSLRDDVLSWLDRSFVAFVAAGYIYRILSRRMCSVMLTGR